jgi:hypothetical protein
MNDLVPWTWWDKEISAFATGFNSDLFSMLAISFFDRPHSEFQIALYWLFASVNNMITA